MSSSNRISSVSYIISKPTLSEKKEITQLMENIFFKTDPSSIYSKVSEMPNISVPLKEMAVESLVENLSLVAKEKNIICGVAINGSRPATIRPEYLGSYLVRVQSKNEKTLLELWKFLAEMPPQSEKYFPGVTEIFEVRYLVVNPEQRNKGVASALINQSKKEAKNSGFKYLRIDCTSDFSARIAKNIGMECIYKLNYEDYKDSSGKHVFSNIIFPHTKMSIYAGEC